MKKFSGKVLFLDRSDINTDEIIPAKYLTEVDKKALKPYLLEDLKLEGFSAESVRGKEAVVSRANFGCGSSREDAPWAFEVNGINIVVAENFARIFRQNMFNCGMLAVELSKDEIDEIFRTFSGKETEIEANIDKKRVSFTTGSVDKTYEFEISGFSKELVKAGGWVNYADSKY